MKPIFERLQISGEVWCELVKSFGRLFYAVAGKPHEIDAGAKARRPVAGTKPSEQSGELLACDKTLLASESRDEHAAAYNVQTRSGDHSIFFDLFHGCDQTSPRARLPSPQTWSIGVRPIQRGSVTVS